MLTNTILRTACAAASAIGLLVVPAVTVTADGTETLGPPSIPIASGSGTVAAGVGLEAGPGTIDIDVPGAVVQAILYWEGMSIGPVFDDTITVNGVPVTGAVIGGPTLFFSNVYSTTLRADITPLGLVAAGANSLHIDDIDFSESSDGAGLLVIYDDGSTADIEVRDGNDLAFVNFSPPLDTTVPQTFAFDPEPVDRTATITVFAASVARSQNGMGLRPSVIEVTIGGVTSEYVDVLDSVDGDEWDTIEIAVDVPAGADELTIQALSDDRTGSGRLPASFTWTAAVLSVETTPPPTSVPPTTVPPTTAPPTTVPPTTAPPTTAPPTSEPTEPTIQVASFSPLCQADIPYIEWTIEVAGTDADTAEITFIDDRGDPILTLVDQPLVGQVLYPGANDDPPSWPGWSFENGRWVPDDSNAHWRNGLSVRVEVNPTAISEVAYPSAAAACDGPTVDQNPPPAVPPGPNTQSSPPNPTQVQLPPTGATSTQLATAIATTLVLGGWTLLLLQRRARRATSD